MNRKRNEELIRLAFGDLRDAEAEQLRAKLERDPQALKELGTYECLRADLRRLDDVPEPQISKEMIRDAILQRGLKPAGRPFSWLSLGWIPAGAAALLFGAVVFQRLNTGPVQIVSAPEGGNPVVAKNADSPQLAFGGGAETHRAAENFTSKPLIDSSSAGSILSGASQLSLPKAPTADRVRSSQARPKQAVAKVVEPAAKASGSPRVSFTLASRGAVTADESGAKLALNPPTEEPIVMIEPDQDVTSGAQRATEVESASNVLVGG